MLDLGRRSTTDFKTAHTAEEARERRWESTFFMINVIFLLILFFIVAARFDVHMQVTPPKSDAANILPPDAPQLTFTAEGWLFLNGNDVTGQPLASRLDSHSAVELGAEFCDTLTQDAPLIQVG